MISAARYFSMICLAMTLPLSSCSNEGRTYGHGRGNDYMQKPGAALFSDWKPSEREERYLELLKSALVEDKTYNWNTLSSALVVRALPYSPEVAGAADKMHGGSPYFTNEIGRWGRGSTFKPGAPVIILLGIYAPDLTDQDITKLQRFRPVLVSADGRSLKPSEIKRYGRAATFISDHFPVFNHWEEVYMLKFPAPERAWQGGSLDFRLEWPGGTQYLNLKSE